MRAAFRSWSIARQIALLIAASLLLLTAGNMIVTFAGPPPRAAPFRLSDLAAVLQQDRDGPFEPRLTAPVGAATFSGRGGESDRPEAARRLAQLLNRPLPDVRMATSEPLLPSPGRMRPGEQLVGTFSVGIRSTDGNWRIIRSVPAPWFTAWHRTTLAITVSLAVILALVAFAITRGIVQPIRRLSKEADRAWLDGSRSTITIGGPPEVAHLAQTISAMRDRFAALVENRTMMLAAIAHDMASPLSRLEFHVAKLANPAVRREAEADLAELSAMIASILDFAKGQEGLRMEPVEIAELAREVIARRTQAAAPLKEGEMPPQAWVRGDRLALRRLIDNLAGNAQRYAGGGVIEIEALADRVRFSMLDDGPGFEPHLAERLFEPFFRVEQSRNRSTAGTGLGLATARAIAEAHGGTLVAHNRRAAGAAFVLELPRHAASDGCDQP